ncbi:uncharacterized protein B0H64DRAFT_417271 [Chaetomium fimeti]|uniref:RING-type domain-containing protein n=1 Tax=Chaetomium fimeti TaxID=1854472 RepID=A0AAE0LSV9_9PEZI|nr:hypothetical protein B0H64DRAFT_417271 [Chaetomium fimeti]
MANNFFDGTWSDFFDDPALLGLQATLALSLEPPSPRPQRIHHMPPVSSRYTLEQNTAQDARFRSGFGDRPASSPFGAAVVREATGLPPSEVLGNGFMVGPTRPASTPRRPERSRLEASLARAENPTTDLLQLNSPPRRAPTFPAILPPPSLNHTTLSSTFPTHGLPNSQRRHNDIFPASIPPRGIQRSSSQRRSPRHDHAGDITTSVPFTIDDDFSRQPATHRATPFSDDTRSVPRLPTMMSSNAGRRNVRPSDLTLPSTPSQPTQSSRPAHRTTRRSTSQSVQPEQGASGSKRKREPDFDDLFGESPFDGQEVVDLVDKDEMPIEILNSQEEKKNYIRMSSFDCVICMDSVKDLTVTHCGHLFCSGCLHSALNMDQSRRICPICRQKIDKVPAGNNKFGQKAKGYYSLELKLMTRKSMAAKAERSSV